MIQPELPLPDAPEIEGALLGALLNGQDWLPFDVIMASLEPGDFQSPKHIGVFAIIRNLHERGLPVNTTTVYMESRIQTGASSAAAIGGIGYLSEMQSAQIGQAVLESYLSILREKSLLRRLIRKTDEISSRAYAGESAVGLVSELQNVGETVKLNNGKGSLKEVSNMIEEIGVDELLTPQHQPGIEPPIAWLAERMRFSPKTLTILAARTSVGKSALALQIMHEAASRRYRTILASLEMNNADLVRRSVGQQGRVNLHRLRNGLCVADERAAAHTAISELCDMKDLLLFDDRGLNSIPAINRALHQLRLEGRAARFLIVDYLQLMEPIGKFGTRQEEVSSLSRGLKQIAQRFDIPVLALSQLSRKADETGREPILSDLRESGSLEQDADNVIFLHRKGNPDEEVQDVRLILAKNRAGPCGRCDLLFTRRYVRFDQSAEVAA